MKRSTCILAASAAGVIVLAGLFWLLLSERGGDAPVAPEEGMPRYRVSGLEIVVTTEPATPRVGENRLIVELGTPEGEPVTGVSFEAYAEMPAMGAMPAMRAPADMREVAPGRYAGSMDIPMRGPWPLTLSFESPEGRAVRLQFDLATGREGLTLASGAQAIGGAAAPADGDADIITVDSHRQQAIGVETGKAARRHIVQSIRAVGTVTFDERLLSHVTLRFDGYIGDLEADYVGAPVEKGQVLFTVYSPDLLAAQQEYLEALKRRGGGDASGPEDPLLRAARQRLALWNMSAATIEALERTGTPREYVPIIAPQSGTLIERNVADGGSASAGQTLLVIADLSRVWVEAEVFEGDLALVREGVPATVNLPYLPDRTYGGIVDYVYPWLDGDSRTGRVRLSLDNPAGELKPDMYAEVALQADLGERLTVPEEAIIFAGENRIAFVDLGGGRLKPVRVRTGHRVEGFVEITGGLSPGDTVVTSANFLIAAEARLKAALDQW